jgi:Na+/phosphate symporter
MEHLTEEEKRQNEILRHETGFEQVGKIIGNLANSISDWLKSTKEGN